MAVRFDQTSDRITYAGALPNPADGFTLTCWAMPIVDTNNNATLARLHVAAGDSTSVTFATDTDGLAGPGFFTVGGSVINPTGMALAQWRKLGVTQLGTTGQVYEATELGATVLASGTVGGAANPTAITLGGRSAADANEPYDGRLAYVRLFSGRLTQGAIEAEWASTVPVSTGSIFADWPLPTASDLTDHSGNGRHLSAGTTPVTTEAGPTIGATVTGAALLSLGALGLVATGVRATVGAAQFNLGAIQLTAQQSQRRILISGREPVTRVSGRRPPTHVTNLGG